MSATFLEPVPPGPERLRRFREEGFFATAPILTPEECDVVIAEYERIGRVIAVGSDEQGSVGFQPMMHVKSPLLQRYAADRRFIEIVAPLIGDDIRLYWEQAVTKPPNAVTEVPWHQDNGYGPTDPAEYATCWLALEDATLANGCLWVQPASHRRGTVAHRATGVSFLLSAYDGADAGIAAPVPRGAAVVISSLLLHRSGPNTTASSRPAWVLQYCNAQTVHGDTREPFDDRLLIALRGVPLDPYVRERPFRFPRSHHREPS
jgi:phytanoyl-CoA hydroxylase